MATPKKIVASQKKVRGGYFGDGAFKIWHFRGFFGDPDSQGVATHGLKSEKTVFFGLQKKSLFGQNTGKTRFFGINLHPAPLSCVACLKRLGIRSWGYEHAKTDFGETNMEV